MEETKKEDHHRASLSGPSEPLRRPGKYCLHDAEMSVAGNRGRNYRVQHGDAIDFSKLDIVLLGGGSDREQAIVCKNLLEIQKDFKDYVEDHGVVIAVCGGYQLLGKYYKTDEGMIEGLHLVDMYTEQGEGRLIDNIVLKSSLTDMPVVGFENHGGRTYIGDNEPFGEVLYGHGNDGTSGYEGVVYKNVIGTYLHGPLLPKNPEVCDWLLRRALGEESDGDGRACTS